ncbi:MAG TPA: hypothetical protein VFY66_02840 [Anaerolineales bacterium]|nr:hypothetical protein [Anaerolineales bacterium]
MNQELTTFIIKELSKHRDRKDIVRKVCERAELPWKDAERLITLVEAQHRRSIRIPQTPWLLFLSIGTLLLGIGLLAFNLQIILAFFQKDVLDQVLGLQSNSYQVMGLITGLGMTAVGLIGLWKAFGVMFPE